MLALPACPLAEFVSSMAALADSWGWRGSAVPKDSPYTVRQSKNNRQRPLEVLLEQLAAEAHPLLPPWYTCIDTLAQHLDTTPSRDKLVAALQARGYIACLCHVEVSQPHWAGLFSSACNIFQR